MTPSQMHPAGGRLAGRPAGRKLGIVGKGGVGKTTVSGLLCRALADQGLRVIAIDTDSNPNLGLSLGLSLEQTEAVPELPRQVIVGAAGSRPAGELIAQFGRATPAGPTLLSALKVAAAGAGCTCGGHATVRSLLADELAEADVTLVDMEAGLEHLSRSGGTLAHADLLVVVCEPTRTSVLTAARTSALAAELGIAQVVAVGNKVREQADEQFLREALAQAGIAVAAVLPYAPDVAAADRSGAVGLLPVPAAVEPALRELCAAVLGDAIT